MMSAIECQTILIHLLKQRLLKKNELIYDYLDGQIFILKEVLK